MPCEISLNDPLSGEEIKAIVLGEISAAMDKNCTLANDLAYAGFSVAYEVKIGFLRAATKETLVWGTAKDGEAPTDPPEAVAGDYKTDSPNAARESHELPTPVMVQTAEGPVRMKVHVVKKAKVKKK